MSGMRKVMTTAGLLSLALLPMVGAASPKAAPSWLDKPMPVAIAQPLGASPGTRALDPILPESAMLVLVGSALFGLAAVVRKNTW